MYHPYVQGHQCDNNIPVPYSSEMCDHLEPAWASTTALLSRIIPVNANTFHQFILYCFEHNFFRIMYHCRFFLPDGVFLPHDHDLDFWHHHWCENSIKSKTQEISVTVSIVCIYKTLCGKMIYPSWQLRQLRGSGESHHLHLARISIFLFSTSVEMQNHLSPSLLVRVEPKVVLGSFLQTLVHMHWKARFVIQHSVPYCTCDVTWRQPRPSQTLTSITYFISNIRA